jgi:hypothetical protein
MDPGRPRADDRRREEVVMANAILLHPASKRAGELVLHAPPVGQEIALSAFVLTVLAASAALLFAVLGL